MQNQQTRELIIARKTSHKQQQRLESPTVTVTWHASKYKVHEQHLVQYINSCAPVWPSGKAR